ncbi:unnamed protein product [Amaranthus hypochondriacus]
MGSSLPRKGAGQVVQKDIVPAPISTSDLTGVEEGVGVPISHKEKGKAVMNNDEVANLSINASDKGATLSINASAKGAILSINASDMGVGVPSNPILAE